jgi:hypothetical protein
VTSITAEASAAPRALQRCLDHLHCLAGSGGAAEKREGSPTAEMIAEGLSAAERVPSGWFKPWAWTFSGRAAGSRSAHDWFNFGAGRRDCSLRRSD